LQGGGFSWGLAVALVLCLSSSCSHGRKSPALKMDAQVDVSLPDSPSGLDASTSDGASDPQDGSLQDRHIETERWVPLPLSGAPSARSGHTAVWTGRDMIVWGGQTGKPDWAVQATGGKLDFAKGEWKLLPRFPNLVPRTDHVAVWIQPRMWLWGGSLDEGETSVIELLNGAWYQPDLDEWSTPQSEWTPQGRMEPAVVWTGRHVLVWGGATELLPGYLADGGVYDPTTDRWKPMSTVGAPSGRYGTTAVWTGSRMLVWGGRGDETAPLSGGAYDPENDRWTTLSSRGAPEVTFPVAIFDGTNMIVWGQSPLKGVQTSGLQTVGAAYHPASDSWRPIALEGGPSSRALASAIWTGRWMVVWGGRSPEGTTFGDGARYDPTANAWMPLPSEGSPRGRTGHTVIWAGNAMLVWGGLGDNGAVYDDGAAYFPPQ
jgi:hypothetical protein